MAHYVPPVDLHEMRQREDELVLFYMEDLGLTFYEAHALVCLLDIRDGMNLDTRRLRSLRDEQLAHAESYCHTRKRQWRNQIITWVLMSITTLAAATGLWAKFHEHESVPSPPEPPALYCTP